MTLVKISNNSIIPQLHFHFSGIWIYKFLNYTLNPLSWAQISCLPLFTLPDEFFALRFLTKTSITWLTYIILISVLKFWSKYKSYLPTKISCILVIAQLPDLYSPFSFRKNLLEFSPNDTKMNYMKKLNFKKYLKYI